VKSARISSGRFSIPRGERCPLSINIHQCDFVGNLQFCRQTQLLTTNLAQFGSDEEVKLLPNNGFSFFWKYKKHGMHFTGIGPVLTSP
jgi:hypothetical protein